MGTYAGTVPIPNVSEVSLGLSDNTAPVTPSGCLIYSLILRLYAHSHLCIEELGLPAALPVRMFWYTIVRVASLSIVY